MSFPDPDGKLSRSRTVSPPSGSRLRPLPGLRRRFRVSATPFPCQPQSRCFRGQGGPFSTASRRPSFTALAPRRPRTPRPFLASRALASTHGAPPGQPAPFPARRLSISGHTSLGSRVASSSLALYRCSRRPPAAHFRGHLARCPHPDDPYFQLPLSTASHPSTNLKCLILLDL